jgi:mannose-1-phosphate guanylyltransferase
MPKPMLPIVHRPMIVRLVERLAVGGVTDVVLALGFRPEPFATAFPGGTHGDVRVHYAVEPEPLDTAGAIAFAARSVGVDDTFVVANGDIVTDLDVATLVDVHRRCAYRATIHLTPVDDPSAFGVAELDDRGSVQRFVEKPAPGDTESNLINGGTSVLEASVLDLIEPGCRVSVERDTFPRLVADGTLGGLPTDDYWIDAGVPETYLRANLDLISGVRGSPLPSTASTARVSSDAKVVRTVVDADVEIAGGARVSDSVLLPGAVIESGAVVRSSIVAGRVEAAATVVDSVVGAGHTVGVGEQVEGSRVPNPG